MKQALHPLLLASTLLALAACERSGSPSPAGPPSPNSEATPTRAEPAPAGADEPTSAPPPLISDRRRLMGTIFLIRVAASPEVARPAIAAAYAELERLEGLLSEWREDSEISRINQSAGREPVAVSEETFAVVKAGVDVSRWSDGAFDLSWAAMHGLYEFQADHQRIPSDEELAEKLPLIDWREIELDESARTVFLRREYMAIGTGGIGKGYALDRAAAILRDAGIPSFMIFGGGQVQVHGMRGDRPWRVGIQHPRRGEEYFAYLESSGGSISTSGDYEHFHIASDGRRWHHIIDPRTGRPADRSVAVTLMGPSGLYADALSTAAFVMGPEAALPMLAGLPFEVDAAMLDGECRLFTTPGTREKMVFRMELLAGVLPGCD